MKKLIRETPEKNPTISKNFYIGSVNNSTMRKKALLVLFLVLCFLIGGCLGPSKEIDKGPSDKGSGKEKTGLELCEKASPIYREKKCKAILNKNPGKCDEVKEEQARTECYFWVAFQEKNSTVCERIKQVGEYDSYGKYYYSLCKASAQRNPQRCDFKKVTGSYGGHFCELLLALQNKNSTICGEDKLCRAIAEKNSKFCEGASFEKEECYFKMATLTQNKSICDNLEGTEKIGKKAACIKMVERSVKGMDCSNRYFDNICAQIALLKEKPSICSNVGFQSPSCYENLAYIKSGAIPKDYLIFKEMARYYSIEFIDKKCSKIGKVCGEGKWCSKKTVRTPDATKCCLANCE